MLLTAIAALIVGTAAPDIAILPLDLPNGQLSPDEESSFQAVFRGEVEALNLNRAGWIAVEQAFANAGHKEQRCLDPACMKDLGARLGVKRVVRIRAVPYAGPRLMLFSLVAHIGDEAPDDEFPRDYAKDDRLPLLDTFRNAVRHTLGELRLESEEVVPLTLSSNPAERPGATRFYLGAASGGVGLLALGAGALSHLSMNARSAELGALRAGSVDAPATNGAEAARLVNERDGARLRTVVFYSAGAALLGAGAFMLLQAKGSSDEPAVAFVLSPTGISIVGAMP